MRLCLLVLLILQNVSSLAKFLSLFSHLFMTNGSIFPVCDLVYIFAPTCRFDGGWHILKDILNFFQNLVDCRNNQLIKKVLTLIVQNLVDCVSIQ